jgi:hypothetical protein
MAKKRTVRRKPAPEKPRKPRRPRPAIALAPIRPAHRAGKAMAGAGGLEALAPAAGDTIDVTFRLRNVQGALVRDPLGIFTFKRLTGGHQLADQGRTELTGAAVSFSIAADREAATCEIDLQRYRVNRSPVFMTATGSSPAFDVPLLREPDEWRPRFTPWAALPGDFAALQAVLVASADVALLDTPQRFPSLAGDAYDAVADATAILAKAALLNVYYRLRTTGPPIVGAGRWFSFVQRIVAVGRERFVAFVKAEMADAVRNILDHIDEFDQEFERADSSLHLKNVPIDLRPRIAQVFSLKSSHKQGNYQLTLIELSQPQEVLLDADIDESGTFWGHFRDVFKHKITGGTHPVDVHEILVRQEGQTAGFDLGYSLV